jgi:hypothetical protein
LYIASGNDDHPLRFISFPSAFRTSILLAFRLAILSQIELCSAGVMASQLAILVVVPSVFMIMGPSSSKERESPLRVRVLEASEGLKGTVGRARMGSWASSPGVATA